ncbi:MAG: hypothetical protein EBT33_22670, partial [Betaproteobacteria bacterium]|nr:hypothetical protein [Betaproteobacteria bacterium]
QASSKLRYTGPLTSVTLTLSSTTPSTVPGQTTVTGIQLAEPVQPQGVRLSIPTAIYVTPGAPAPIRLGTTPFTTTETGSISIEIEAERQFLTIDGVKPASAATAWPTTAQSVSTTAGTAVTITEGTSFLRTDGVSRNATRFTGTAAALNALFNTVGEVWYDTIDGSVLRIRTAGSMEALAAISLIQVSASATTVSGPSAVSIALPEKVTITSGVQSQVKLPSVFTSTSPGAEYTLELSANQGLLATPTLTVGTNVGGVTLLAGSTSTLVKLQGTAASLNSYLTSDKLRFTRTGVGTLASLGLKLINGDGLRSAAATLSLQAAVRTETQGYGGAMVLPKTLLATPGALLPITLASDAFEAAAGWITVEIEAPRSAFSITGMTDPVATIGAISGVNVQSASITPAGGGASVPVTRFTGTSANVNALFSTPGQVLLNTTGISTLKLRLAGSEASITITTKTAEDVGYGASITLPQAFLVSSGT